MTTKQELIQQITRRDTLSYDEIQALKRSPRLALECLIRLVEHYRDRTFGDAATVLLHEGRYFTVRADATTDNPQIPRIISAHQINHKGKAVESYLLRTILDTPHAIPWLVEGRQNVVLIGSEGGRLAGNHEMFVVRIREKL